MTATMSIQLLLCTFHEILVYKHKKGGRILNFSLFFFPFFVLHKVEMHLIAGEETFPLFFSLFMCYYPA